MLNLAILLAIASTTYNQIPVTNGYISNNYIDKFEGNWHWSSGTDTVKIRIKKMALKLTQPENSYREILLGCHTYIDNGNILESSMNKYDSLVSFNKDNLATIFVYHIINSDTSVVKGSFQDISRHKRVNVKMEYLPGNPAQIRMRLKPASQISYTYPSDPNPNIPGISLPSDIILTKQ